ncbi:MAG: polysaccharide pyruvyl transferase family protein [Lentisphaerae bacterium]|nr:polysaccharide pyruvyl transferase family protein [Lentisphaerota bacterium]
MKTPKALAKIVMQIYHTMYLALRGESCLYVNGAIHINTENLSFSEHNFGDDVNLPLVEALTGQKAIPYKFTFGTRTKDVFLIIGSIIEDYSLPNAVIWGAGLIDIPSKKITPPRKVCAVRGPLTRAELLKQDIACPEVYGDPAILLPAIYRPGVSKKYRLGIIPHVADKKLPAVQQLIQTLPPDDATLIDMEKYGHWRLLLDRLCECETIISSSLHGVVLADAYQIPNRWVEFSDNVTGAGFKFRDYYAGSGRSITTPLPIKDSLPSYHELITAAAAWEHPRFNYQALLAACPLPLRHDLKLDFAPSA